MARVEVRTLSSGGTVSIHTKLTFRESLNITKRRREIQKMKDETKAHFAGLTLFIEGWTLKSPETGDLLPFDAEGLQNADVVDVGEMVQLMNQVEAGQVPNVSRAKSPATGAEASRKRPSRTQPSSQLN